jgi:hypothetical protein
MTRAPFRNSLTLQGQHAAVNGLGAHKQRTVGTAQIRAKSAHGNEKLEGM